MRARRLVPVLCVLLVVAASCSTGPDPDAGSTPSTSPDRTGRGLAAACEYWERNEPPAKARFQDADVLAGATIDPDDPQRSARSLSDDLRARRALFTALREGYLLATDDPDVGDAARRVEQALGTYLADLAAIEDDLTSEVGVDELIRLYYRLDDAHTRSGAALVPDLDAVTAAARTTPGCSGWLQATSG